MTDRSPTLADAAPVDAARAVSPSRLGQRRPVLTFLALVGLAGGVLGATWWTGAVNPRLGGVASVGWSSSGQAASFVELTNDGPLAIEVEAVAGPTRGIDRTEVLIGPPGSTIESSWPDPPSPFRGPDAENGTAADAASWTPVAPFVLEPGESRIVLVQGVLPCEDRGGDPAESGFERLQVDVRTWLGAHQRVQVPPSTSRRSPSTVAPDARLGPPARPIIGVNRSSTGGRSRTWPRPPRRRWAPAREARSGRGRGREPPGAPLG